MVFEEKINGLIRIRNISGFGIEQLINTHIITTNTLKN